MEHNIKGPKLRPSALARTSHNAFMFVCQSKVSPLGLLCQIAYPSLLGTHCVLLHSFSVEAIHYHNLDLPLFD